MAFSVKKMFPCDIYAKERGEVVLFHRESILETCGRDERGFRNIIGLFSEGLLNFVRRTELFSYSSIRQKIALYLLNSETADNRNEITLPYPKATWARSLNVSRPALLRELKLFTDKDILLIEGYNIIIKSREMLESVFTGELRSIPDKIPFQKTVNRNSRYLLS